MRDHSPNQLPLVLLVLLLVLGGVVLTQYEKLPHWLWYALMLAVLVGCRRLAPEWFAERWFSAFWYVAVGVAAGGLLLEVVSPLLA